LLLSAALCFSVWLKSSDLYKRKQAALLGLAFSLALAGTGFNYTALLSHRLFPPVNISAWMIAALPAIIAAARYQLFPRYPEMMEETILHFLPDSLLVTDLQGRISLANNAFYELAELDQNQAVHARTLSEVMLDKATANFLTHQIINQNRMIFDCPLALKNSILSLNAAQIRDHTGDKIGMVIIGRDVTERKKNESELKNITETLEKKLKEIDYLNRLFVEREIEMSQLKEEISALRKEPGHD
jgi:PAS domain-containing protein